MPMIRYGSPMSFGNFIPAVTSPSRSSVAIKAYVSSEATLFGKEEIRRFIINGNFSNAYQQLMDKLIGVLPASRRSSSLVIRWKDEEGDLITVSTNQELESAIEESNGSTFKVYVSREFNEEGDMILVLNNQKSKNSDIRKNAIKCNNIDEETQSSGKLHPNITCDGCDGEVHGFRYRCMECEDYDLCQICEFKGFHPQHKMCRVPKPLKKLMIPISIFEEALDAMSEEENTEEFREEF